MSSSPERSTLFNNSLSCSCCINVSSFGYTSVMVNEREISISVTVDIMNRAVGHNFERGQPKNHSRPKWYYLINVFWMAAFKVNLICIVTIWAHVDCNWSSKSQLKTPVFLGMVGMASWFKVGTVGNILKDK